MPTHSFSHRAESSYAFAPHGRHVAVLHGPDGGQIALQGAAFVRNRFDEAGSFLGESYVETFDLYVVGERHTLTWSSVAAISLKTDGAPLRVALRDGSTVEGFPDRLVAPNTGIQGSRQIGRHTLAAAVSLCDWTDKAFEKLALRQ